MSIMWYAIAADALVVIHLGYVAYIVLGLSAILLGVWRNWRWVRNPWFRTTHLAAILLVVFELILKLNCPLTLWEMKLRAFAGQTVTEVSFLQRLMAFLLMGSAPGWLIAMMYFVFAIAIMAAFAMAPPRWRTGQ